MKRFIISVLSVSVFFIGLGGLVEQTSAKFKSDARALELIRLARIAVGGDANIKNVRSMTITGTSSHNFEINGIAETKQGTMEINFELPGKFSKMFRIGNPGDGAAQTDIQKQVDVVIMRKADPASTELKDPGEGKKVIIVRKDDGTVLTENIEGDAKIITEDIKNIDGERRIIIKKDDGTIEEIRPADGKTFTFERKPGDDTAVWTTEDGKTVTLNKEFKSLVAGEHGALRQNEMLRTTLALLLTAPEGMDVSYSFAGETTVDGATANVIDVDAMGSKFKLYLDKTTNLPKMLSYMGPQMRVFKFDKPVPADGVAQKDVKVFVGKAETSEMVEHQVRFSDFRSVGGLLLPHRWTQTAGDKAGETIDITNYEINPANISDKFQNQRVLIRTMKDQ